MWHNKISLFWGSTGFFVYDLHLTNIPIYLIIMLYAAPQFSFCVKQVILAFVSDCLPSGCSILADS